MVAEILYDQPDGHPSEGVPDEIPGVHFGDVEPDDRNLTPAQAQLNDLLQSSNRMLKTVERINGCSLSMAMRKSPLVARWRSPLVAGESPHSSFVVS